MYPCGCASLFALGISGQDHKRDISRENACKYRKVCSRVSQCNYKRQQL